MGVARILERVVQNTSGDVGDLTKVTACLSLRSLQACEKVGDFAFRHCGIHTSLSMLPL